MLSRRRPNRRFSSETPLGPSGASPPLRHPAAHPRPPVAEARGDDLGGKAGRCQPGSSWTRWRKQKSGRGTLITSAPAKLGSCVVNNGPAPLTVALALMTGFVTAQCRCTRAAGNKRRITEETWQFRWGEEGREGKRRGVGALRFGD